MENEKEIKELNQKQINLNNQEKNEEKQENIEKEEIKGKTEDKEISEKMKEDKINNEIEIKVKEEEKTEANTKKENIENKNKDLMVKNGETDKGKEKKPEKNMNILLTKFEEEKRDKDNKLMIDFFIYLSKQNNKNDIDSNNIKNQNEKYILQTFIEAPKEVYEKSSNLKLFIKELIIQLNRGNNIIIPFLNLCPFLVEAYIESDLDEDNKDDFKYNEVFKLLKINSFINKEYIFPIYEYFSDLYFGLKEVKDNKKLKKFNKVFELMKIFYDFDINKDDLHQNNCSSFCFIEGRIKVELSEEISLENYQLKIIINLLNNSYINYKKNLILFLTEGICINNINDLLKETDIKIIILINLQTISLTVMNNKETISSKNFFYGIVKIKSFYLLENYYGQIKSIELIQINQNKNGNINNTNNLNTINEIFEPYILYDDRYLYHKNNNSFVQISNDTNDNINNENVQIIAEKNNLFKSNYINYLDEEFNLIEYFGGFTPFIPFIPLINGIYKNPEIQLINETNKKEYFTLFFYDFLLMFFKILTKYKKKYEKYIDKYTLFFFALIFELDRNIICKDDTKKNDMGNDFFDTLNNFPDEEGIIMFIFGRLANDNINSLDKNLSTGIHMIKERLSNDFHKKKNPLFIKNTEKQLYKHIMKELFIYNRLWSRKNLFFKNESKYKLKYKQLSYYTQNYQQPLLYPILDFMEYLPHFSKFDTNNLFKHDINEVINYDFSFKENLITEFIRNNNPLNESKENRLKCCLVKQFYHVKGEIIIIKRQIVQNQFEIIFSSNYDNKGEETCNRNNSCKKIDKNNLCYGSNFLFHKKEFNRKILIKSKDIKLVFIRNYYRKTSAIEIFTYKSNKSYYFNFKNFIDINNPNSNPILKFVNDNPNFKKNKIKDNIIVYYNQNYTSALFPLFLPKKISKLKNIIQSELEQKIIFYNNFDLLAIINLLSNRSFRDLYQYPIFPMLYKENDILKGKKNEERDLGQHLGIQDLNEESKIRKSMIEETYQTELLTGEESDKEFINNLFLLKTHYSNPVYTSNFLIRIFPYSLLAIEYQGEGFDLSDRLFFSVQRTLENTLGQKSDLRELIPEIYYFPDLYANKNELKFQSTSEGYNIDNVAIKHKKDEAENIYEKYAFIEKIKNHLEFDSLKINSWINLLFGKNQKKTNNNINYYEKEKYISFNKYEQEKEINDFLIMQKYEFGIQPYQLYNKEFPEINYKEKLQNYLTIKRKNLAFFELEHKKIIGKINCFKCEGNNNKYEDSICTIFNRKTKDLNNIDYLFYGDVFGNITIYRSKNKNYSLFKKICDHYKQIKYIDYNPRLNLFLSYSLDGYIHIYVFPKCKLVRVIKVKDITDSDEILKKVVLVSNPFPMIFTYDNNAMYVISLNGELINKKNLENKGVEIFPCIDKKCGLINDTVFINKNKGIVSNKEKDNKIDSNHVKEIKLPSL